MLATNPHGFLIRQYYRDSETLNDKRVREYALTKIIETFYFVSRYARNVTHTDHPTDVVDWNAAGPADSPAQYKIDPYFLPEGVSPIDNITLAARGQTFYRNLKWEEISSVHPNLFCSDNNMTSSNHCVGLLSFALYYFKHEHTGSYNSGYGPNCRLLWTINAFTIDDPGLLDTIIQGLNMVLAYKGSLTIRYT